MPPATSPAAAWHPRSRQRSGTWRPAAGARSSAPWNARSLRSRAKAERMSFAAESAGRFAREALEGSDGEVCALFRRSFYLRCPGERYACVGDRSVGNGPLNVLVPGLVLPRLGDRVSVSFSGAKAWQPPLPVPDQPHLTK